MKARTKKEVEKKENFLIYCCRFHTLKVNAKRKKMKEEKSYTKNELYEENLTKNIHETITKQHTTKRKIRQIMNRKEENKRKKKNL